MKLIIEKIGDQIFAYREREKHFRAVEDTRGTPRLDPTVLDNDCDITNRSDFHMIFDLKKVKK